MRIDITAHPAEDIVMDLAGVRELQAENARLTEELAEARKQPVRVLPEITIELYREWMRQSGGRSLADQWNIVLARHFRKADPPKPALDVEAVVDEIACKYNTLGTWLPGLWTDLDNIIRRHFTDTPGENLKGSGVTITADGITVNGVKIAESLQKVQQLPDEKSLRRQIAAYLRANGERIETGEMSVLDAAREIELGAGAQPVDELLVAAVARVERETRAKCAAMVRDCMQWWGVTEWPELADRMERGE